MDKLEDILKEERIIKQFKKKKNELVHPLFPDKKIKGDSNISIGLLTLGHLWLYKLVEEYGYAEFLKEILDYAICKKSALFEWEIDDTVETELAGILLKHDIVFLKYLDQDFQIYQYSDIDSLAKDKDHPFHHLTRLLALAELEMATQIISIRDDDLEELLCTPGSIINATYLCAKMVGKEKIIMEKVPDWFYDLIKRNMGCYYETENFRYYPKMDEFMKVLNDIEQIFTTEWYLISDNDQVIISKFLYSIRIIKELSTSLLGLNGILSAVSTRILFDNYWQTLFLIKNNKVEDYREFVLNRMRLHILKRDDSSDENIGELIRAIDGGLFDPIPVNGDYFTKSARDYAIELSIKEDYDKYYEYNSEYIHASLTAVYSGIMVPCKNPEHDSHLTIKDGGARLVDSVKGIFTIINKHIALLNDYYDEEIIVPIDTNKIFCSSRDEWTEYMNECMHR